MSKVVMIKDAHFLRGWRSQDEKNDRERKSHLGLAEMMSLPVHV